MNKNDKDEAIKKELSTQTCEKKYHCHDCDFESSSFLAAQAHVMATGHTVTK